MEIVEPIRDPEKIQKMKEYLKAKSDRDYMLFIIGINTALRISDILKLKAGDVRGKTHLEIKETKTRKRKKFKMNSFLISELSRYVQNLRDEHYLIHSSRSMLRPIDRHRAYVILNEAAKAVGIQGRIGTHTMRKTFGYHFYQKTKDLETLRRLLNHSNIEVTRRYIGIDQDYIDEVTSDFVL